MNILNKNTIVAVIATFCASGIILVAGSGMAEEKGMAISNSGSIVTIKQTESAVKQIIAIEEKKVESSVEVDHFIAPPPGPFFDRGIETLISKTLKAPNAPKAPVSTMKPAKQRANSLHFDSPMPKVAQRIMGGSLKKPIAPQQSSAEPKLLHIEPLIKKEIKTFNLSKQQSAPSLKVVPPVMTKNVAKQPELKIIERPIWVQNNTAKNDLNSALKNQGMMVAPKMNWNNGFPMQQYIYVRVPVMPSNMELPQLPVFNYNMIAPPSYWGVPQLPNNTQPPSMQNNIAKSVGSSLQEGNNK